MCISNSNILAELMVWVRSRRPLFGTWSTYLHWFATIYSRKIWPGSFWYEENWMFPSVSCMNFTKHSSCFITPARFLRLLWNILRPLSSNYYNINIFIIIFNNNNNNIISSFFLICFILDFLISSILSWTHCWNFNWLGIILLKISYCVLLVYTCSFTSENIRNLSGSIWWFTCLNVDIYTLIHIFIIITRICKCWFYMWLVTGLPHLQ